MLASTITITSERSKLVDFIQPFAHVHLRVIIQEPRVRHRLEREERHRDARKTGVHKHPFHWEYRFDVFEPFAPETWATASAFIVIVSGHVAVLTSSRQLERVVTKTCKKSLCCASSCKLRGLKQTEALCLSPLYLQVWLFMWLVNYFNPYEYGYQYRHGLKDGDEDKARLFNTSGAFWFVTGTLQWQGVSACHDVTIAIHVRSFE